jgi:hypothetical protein
MYLARKKEDENKNLYVCLINEKGKQSFQSKPLTYLCLQTSPRTALPHKINV